MNLDEAGLYAASARRVLRSRGLHGLGERLRRTEDRLVFVIGSPRSGTTFLAGAIAEQPGFVDLSEVNPHKASIGQLLELPQAEAAARIRTVLERVRALALVRGWSGADPGPRSSSGPRSPPTRAAGLCTSCETAVTSCARCSSVDG